MKKIVCVLAWLSCFAQGPQVNFIPRFTVKHIEADGVGYQGGYTTMMGTLGTQLGENHYPFLDTRWMVLNRGKMALNLGGGYRYNVMGSNVLVGGNFYYDQRGTPGNTFQQIDGGIEVLSPFVDFRANGYLPVGVTKEQRALKFECFAGNDLMVRLRERLALKGVDGEFGAYLGGGRQLRFYGAGGAYFFKRQICNTKLGLKARVQASWEDNIWVQASVTHDDLFHTNVQGIVGVSIPFWSQKAQVTPVGSWNYFPNYQAFLSQPVDHMELMVLCDQERVLKARVPGGGSPSSDESMLFWFVNNLSNSIGSFEDPFPTLVDAQNISSAGDFIYVFEGNGTVQGMDQGIVLKPGQTFLGSSQPHMVMTNFGMVTIPAFTTNPPRITNLAGNGIVLANDTTVEDVQIISPSQNGVFALAVNNLSLAHVDVSGAGANGFSFSKGTLPILDILMSNSSATGSAQDGFLLNAVQAGQVQVRMGGSTFSGNTNDGIMLNANGLSTVNFYTQSVTARGNVNGLSLGNGSATYNVTINDGRFNNNTQHGIEMDVATPLAASVVIDGCECNNNTAIGLFVKADMNSSIECDFSGLIASGNGSEGMVLEADNTSMMTASITTSAFENNTTSGIDLESDQNSTVAVTFDTVTASNNAGFGGIIIRSSNSSTLTSSYTSCIMSNPFAANITGTCTLSSSLVVTSMESTFSDSFTHGIDLSSNSSNLTFTCVDSTFQNCLSSGINLNVFASGANVTLQNNNLNSCARGLIFVSTSSTTSALIENNTVQSNTTDGMLINPAISSSPSLFTANIKDNTFINNTDDGLRIDAASRNVITIENNTMTDNRRGLFYRVDGVGAGSTSPSGFISVIDNTFTGNTDPVELETNTPAAIPPFLCLKLTGNASDNGYEVSNNTGTVSIQSPFPPSAASVQAANDGTITFSGVTFVNSCGAP